MRKYTIWSSEVVADIKGLMAAFPGCTIDGDYLWEALGQGYEDEVIECEYDSLEDARNALDNDPMYHNEISIRDESFISIIEYHVSSVRCDECGYLDDLSLECLYQSSKTEVWYEDDSCEEFDTFEQAKEHALKLLSVAIGRE